MASKQEQLQLRIYSIVSIDFPIRIRIFLFHLRDVPAIIKRFQFNQFHLFANVILLELTEARQAACASLFSNNGFGG